MAAIAGFVEDRPWTDESEALSEYTIEEQIAGVVLQRLVAHSDSRGDLTVLLSEQYGTFDPHPPHVYLVTAAPKSIRAWVYHKRQHDRLACANGNLTIALFDMREDSRTFKKLSVINVGSHNKTLVTIPPYVVHGVYNSGNHDAYFINMPTRSYDPAFPDKSRLKYPNATIPFVF